MVESLLFSFVYDVPSAAHAIFYRVARANKRLTRHISMVRRDRSNIPDSLHLDPRGRRQENHHTPDPYRDIGNRSLAALHNHSYDFSSLRIGAWNKWGSIGRDDYSFSHRAKKSKRLSLCAALAGRILCSVFCSNPSRNISLAI